MAKEEKKLSFSISSSSSTSRPQPPKRPLSNPSPSESKPQFLTVFDPSAAPVDPTVPVIAPIPNNDFRKKLKSLLPSPTRDSPTKFVLEANATADTSNVSYGLTLRSDQSTDDAAADSTKFDKDLTLRRFKEDMESLPDHRGMEEFEEVPIESFAAAILTGYGWKEGSGVGRNNKGDTKVKQYDRRAGTAGLGYAPSKDDPPLLTKRRGEVGFSVKDNAKPKARSEKQKERSEKQKERSERPKERSDRPKERSERPKERKREERGDERSHRKKDGPVQWLRSYIKVRIVSKDIKKGKLYLKKGKVLDVVGPTTCDISMDESGELVQGVDQRMLETALPKRGGPVLVLYGKHKGVFGSLVDRNSEAETGTVEDADSRALIKVRLEEIAEYVGDPSLLDY